VTATMPAGQQTAFRGVIYGIDVLDHVTGRVVPNDYVGKTRQRGRGRENQHRDRQPFSDLIVGSPRVLWEGICTEGELDEWERYFIQDAPVRPRLNVDMNEDNPHRIPKRVQEAQRLQREPGWLPFEQRRRDSLLEWDAVRAGSDTFNSNRRSDLSERSGGISQWPTPILVKACLWSISWGLATSVLWGVFQRNEWLATGRTRLLCASIVMLVALLLGRWLTPRRRREVAKRWRRVRKWLR
jgi:hypothetical protein